jgi:ribosomal-protein-alanine N-acetyltransferase
MILTERLDIVPATVEPTRAALASRRALAAALGVTVPDSWPPEFLDPPALEFVIARLREHPERADWWMRFVILRDGAAGRTLIGTAGFKGPASDDGTVEIGYGIVRAYQRRGYATEVVRVLVAHAFAWPQVSRVVAETFPELEGSLGVLRKCGFVRTIGGSEPGSIRFELTRAAHAHRALGETG